MNIYVGNLSYKTSSDDLKNLFIEHGDVSSANIIIDKESGRSKGFGFIEMPNEAEALKAIEALHESEHNGRPITVNVARPKTERSNDGYNSRRY